MRKSDPQWTPFQRAVIEARTPKPPPSLTAQQRLFFDAAVKKIRFEQSPDGGVSVEYPGIDDPSVHVTRDEAFAMAETGTPDWPFLPSWVRQILKAAGFHGRRGFLDEPGAQQLVEALRAQTIANLGDKAASDLAAKQVGAQRRAQASAANRRKGQASRDLVARTAREVCAGLPRDRIKRDAVAYEIEQKFVELERAGAPSKLPKFKRIRDLLFELFDSDHWPPPPA